MRYIRRKKTPWTAALLASFTGVVPLAAQDTVTLSQVELEQRITSGNLQVRIAEQAVLSAQADLRQSNALFLPDINASHTALLTTNPLMAFGSKLNQEVLTQADFDPSLLNDPDQVENYATKVEVVQPLINLDGWYGRQAARAKMEAYQWQAERTKEHMILEVNKAYLQLQVAHRAVGVLKQAETTVLAHLKLVQDYQEQGMVQETDVLSVQVRVSEVRNQRFQAESNVRNASDYLAFLLNEERSGMVYLPAEPLAYEPTAAVYALEVPETRKDMQALAKTTEAYEKQMRSGKMQLLPRLNAFGSYELYDDSPFQADAQGYTVGAQLSWNLFDGYKTYGTVEKARADLYKVQVEADQHRAQSQLELNQAHRQLRDADNRVQLNQLALHQAREAYRIRSDRFRVGLEKTADLLASETLLYRKELEYLQAVFEYTYAKKYLEFLTQ